MKTIRTVLRNVYRAFAVCAALPMLLASCETSDAEVETPQTEGNFVFQLSLPPALSVDTRSGSIGGTSINDVWVIQFDTSGKKLAAKNFGEGVIRQGDNSALLLVTTDGFSNINSTFRVIGNFGSNQAGLVEFSKNASATKADLQKITVNFDNYKDKSNLLVSNDIEYKSKPADAGKAVIIAPLNFAYAWVDVNWTSKVVAPAKIELKTITAYNLPRTLAIDTRGGKASGVYPDAAVDKCEVASGALKAGTTYAFYMPENLRGMGCGMSFQDKNLDLYAPKPDGTAPTLDADGKPGAGGTLANCTYIDLEGTYQYGNSDGTGPVSGAVAVRYRLYLGGNLMNDYNIRRGYHYTITVEVSGINSGDVRVTITDGAVVVFDKVDTITKEVNFR